MSNDIIGKLIVAHHLKDKGATNINFTEDKWDAIDLTYDFNAQPYAVEVKYRANYTSTSFKDVILEKTKYERLLQRRDTFSKIYYVMIFKDKIGYCFDFDKIEPQYWSTQILPTNEAKTSLIDKEITYLKLKDADYVFNA